MTAIAVSMAKMTIESYRDENTHCTISCDTAAGKHSLLTGRDISVLLYHSLYPGHSLIELYLNDSVPGIRRNVLKLTDDAGPPNLRITDTTCSRSRKLSAARRLGMKGTIAAGSGAVIGQAMR
jgi:hypothetical protein